MFIATIFTIGKTLKQSKHPSTEEWIKQMFFIYTMEYNLVIKKEMLPYVTIWINLEDFMLKDIRQTQKVKYCMYLLICGI